jgi:hypothetical protein
LIERTEERFDLKLEPLAADTGYGSGANLNRLPRQVLTAVPSEIANSRSERAGAPAGEFAPAAFRAYAPATPPIAMRTRILRQTSRCTSAR